MVRVAKIQNADPTGIKDVANESCVQARGVSAQNWFALFYFPLEHVGRLFCRKKWICGDGTGNRCKVNEEYLLRLRKIPFASIFVSLLSNLKAGQDSAVEFSFQSVNGNMLLCFAFHRHSVPRTMMQIIKSIYPELRNKRLRFSVHDWALDLSTGPVEEGNSSTIFYSCEGWSGAGECPPDKVSILEILWHGQVRYVDVDQTEDCTFSHSLTFRANSTWVNARADDQRIRMERVWLALAMGWHRRLGECSQIANINSDVLRSIVTLVFKNQ